MFPVLSSIAPDRLVVRPHNLFNSQWLLLAAGDYPAGNWNAMTIAWGSLGTMWGMPFAQVVVRPQRYTREFMDAFDTFTLTAFPKAFHAALETMGSRSGRQGDKASAAGLTPMAAETVSAPVFVEAELVLECRKLFVQDMTRESFVDARAAGCYPQGDYHRIYYGEIVAARGTALYAAD